MAMLRARAAIASALSQTDPKQRLQAIGDARIQIEEVMSGSLEPAIASIELKFVG